LRNMVTELVEVTFQNPGFSKPGEVKPLGLPPAPFPLTDAPRRQP